MVQMERQPRKNLKAPIKDKIHPAEGETNLMIE